MGNKTRKFVDGEIIFREGEAGASAFVIKQGKVALSKETSRGPVEIEVLDKDGLFGEVGVLNGGQRTLTATAVGALSVEVVGQRNFKGNSLENTSRALVTIPKTVAKAGVKTNLTESSGQAIQNWFSRLFYREARDTAHIEVRIVPLIGEKGDRHARKIFDALASRSELNVKIISGEGPFIQKAMSRNVVVACSRDGRNLLRKSGGDVLIWGDVSTDQKVLHLHFISSVPADEDLPGSFNGHDVLPVPVDISQEWSAFLYAIVLSATVPFSTSKAKILNANIEAALEEGAPTAQKPPREFTTMDRGHLIVCLAHALAITGQRLDETELFQLAGETYRRAIDAMPEPEQSLDRGMARKNLGCVLAIEAERARNISKFHAAADAIRAAIEEIPRRTLPREWAAAQNRLGQILYRLHMADATADTGALTEAISAFHAAVQVYTRVDAPERWADVMNNYAQAAQVLGGQLHDPEILQKAINACRNTLEVRRRDRTPYLWAATHNTLGSALFLMGKITNRIDHLESALDAFHAAHDIYVGTGAAKMARVIARNMEHVRSLLADYKASGINRPARFDEDEPAQDQLDENWWRNNVVDDASHQSLG